MQAESPTGRAALKNIVAVSIKGTINTSPQKENSFFADGMLKAANERN